MDTKLQKALEKNGFIHKYIIAIDHALLWVAALSFAAVLITCGNRRTIQKYNGNWRNSRIAPHVESTNEPKKQ